MREGCAREFLTFEGSGKWFCNAYCRRMARSQRPKRDEDDDREWSFDAEQSKDWDAKIDKLRADLSKRVKHFKVIDGQLVEQQQQKPQEGNGSGEVPPGSTSGSSE